MGRGRGRWRPSGVTSTVAALAAAFAVNVATSTLLVPAGWATTLVWVGTAVVIATSVVVEAFRGSGEHTDDMARPSREAGLGSARDYLARESLDYWQLQAKFRKISTPSPVAVRWRWAGVDVSVAAQEICTADETALPSGVDDSRPRDPVLTAGLVTRLCRQLYEPLGRDDRPARLVILGGAGVGKTAAMLLLLIEVLTRRNSHGVDGGADGSVPIWLTLGGWNPRVTPLRDWAAATLNRDYPGLAAAEYGGPDTAAHLIGTRRVALFLDGLDEMPADLQATALEMIDTDTQGLNLVMTSRPNEYRAALQHGRLYGAAVVDILPVSIDQAEEFLLAEQLGDRRTRWRHVTAQLRLQPDSPAARTLTTPLALSLAREIYADEDPLGLLDVQGHATPDALLRHLMTRSLQLAYPDPREHAHVVGWLTWIAQHMGESPDLRWWDIPTWTSARQPRLVSGLLNGLTGTLVGGVSVGLVDGPAIGLAFGLVMGLLLGSRVVLGRGFRADQSQPQTFVIRRPKGEELSGSLVTGLVVGLVGGLASIPALGLAVGLEVGLVTGLLLGLGVGLEHAWSQPSSTARASTPLETYRSDRRRTLVVGLMFGLMFGLIFGIVAWHALGFRLGVAVGLAGGFTVGIMARQGVAIMVSEVETLFRIQGRKVRFLPLLQTALNKQVLRQAGTAFQFRHAALQDHLKFSGDHMLGEAILK